MIPEVSVIICTFSPRGDYLNRVIESYRKQTLTSDKSELIIVDSASPTPIRERKDLRLDEDIKIIRAPKSGLGLARLTGLSQAQGDFIASLDDDTVMEAGYLQAGVAYLKETTHCGSVSGRLRGEFETTPPKWIHEFDSLLALRDLGNEILTASPAKDGRMDTYPKCAPMGVNISRREICDSYHEAWNRESERQELGRCGDSLDSGEDNDFALFVLKQGWSVAYLPALELVHQIPTSRLQVEYLGRLNQASQKTWARVLLMNELSPWPPIAPWTVPWRKGKSYLARRAWKGNEAYIRWKGACGHFEGRALR